MFDEDYDDFGCNSCSNDYYDAASMGLAIVVIVLISPFMPPFLVGYNFGKLISDMNGIHFTFGALFAGAVFLIYKWVYDNYDKKGVLLLFAVEMLIVDIYFAYTNDRLMYSIEFLGNCYEWFTRKV
jgi:hypothetical protein